MRFDFIIAVAVWFVTTCAYGQSPLKNGTTEKLNGNQWKSNYSEYIMVPVEFAKQMQCQNETLLNHLSIISKPGALSAVKNYYFSINYPYATLAANSMSTIKDDELLCYRCCFSKVNKADCGMFSEKYGDANWAPNCPKSE